MFGQEIAHIRFGARQNIVVKFLFAVNVINRTFQLCDLSEKRFALLREDLFALRNGAFSEQTQLHVMLHLLKDVYKRQYLKGSITLEDFTAKLQELN